MVRIAGSPTLGSGQGLTVIVFVGQHRRAARPLPSQNLSDLIFAARAVGGVSDPHPGLGAIIVVSEDDIHDAADSVGAVKGGGSVQQDIDALDCGGGDCRDIDEVAFGPRTREPASIDEDERGVTAQTA